jgi:uncharacterized protein
VDSRLVSYLYCFNITRDYYECHEYGESLWLDTGRPVVLKGLIQAAVCLYHLQGGNLKGGWAMWQRAKRYLDGERPVYHGIDLDALIRDIDDVFAKVPAEWYGKIVPAKEIEALNLPTVEVRIVDEKIRDILPAWTPEPLDGE